MKQKLGDNKKKRFYSEIWQNAVWGRGEGGGGIVKILWDSPCVRVVLWKLSLSKVASLLRGEVGWNK